MNSFEMGKPLLIGPTKYSKGGRVVFMGYQAGGHGMTIVNIGEGSPELRPAVYLEQRPLPPGEFWIKDYSENQGVKAALEAAGIVEFTGMIEANVYPTHTVEFHHCRITPEAQPMYDAALGGHPLYAF